MNMDDDRSRTEFLSPQSAYDEWAEHYDDEDPSTLLDQPFLLSMLQPFEGCRMLDLGCGTGGTSDWWATAPMLSAWTCPEVCWNEPGGKHRPRSRRSGCKLLLSTCRLLHAPSTELSQAWS